MNDTPPAGDRVQAIRRLALADVIFFPIFILWYIWRGQFIARWAWIFFAVWMAASFLIHGDSRETLGWRADNLRPAARQALIAFALLGAGLLAIGFFLGAPVRSAIQPISWKKLLEYCGFCLLQQTALNSLVENRMIYLVKSPWLSASLAGSIFAACHWPNPVLVPLTFVGGAAMAWMFARVRNILPLAILQALLSTLASWAFPLAWHHHFRVGPGYWTQS